MPGRNKKILLIDDARDLSTLVAKRLRASGYKVIIHDEDDKAIQMIISEIKITHKQPNFSQNSPQL